MSPCKHKHCQRQHLLRKGVGRVAPPGGRPGETRVNPCSPPRSAPVYCLCGLTADPPDYEDTLNYCTDAIQNHKGGGPPLHSGLGPLSHEENPDG